MSTYTHTHTNSNTNASASELQMSVVSSLTLGTNIFVLCCCFVCLSYASFGTASACEELQSLRKCLALTSTTRTFTHSRLHFLGSRIPEIAALGPWVGLYGYDMLIHTDNWPWLLEVSASTPLTANPVAHHEMTFGT